MQKHRLNAFALLYINNDIKLDYSQVIDQFAKENRHFAKEYQFNQLRKNINLK